MNWQIYWAFIEHILSKMNWATVSDRFLYSFIKSIPAAKFMLFRVRKTVKLLEPISKILDVPFRGGL
jgi:hypothetical protein